MTTLTEKQQLFCDTKLRTITSNTGIKGITHHAFSPKGTGAFVVRDLDKAFVSDFGNLDEAVAELLVCVYGFRPPKNETVDAVITYLGAERLMK